MPLLVDAVTGRLLTDSKATIATDLSVIEGNLATIAADLAAPLKNADGAGNALTSTLVTGKQALDVNVVAGGGGGGGGASAQYNATLPTYTSGAAATLQTDVNGRLLTNPSGVTQPVSATALPLPAGASKESGGNLDTIATNTGKIPPPVSGRLPVDGSGVTQPVSASSLPLPSGAATDASLTNGNQKTQVVGTVPTISSSSVPTTYTSSGAVAVNTIAIGPLNISQFSTIMVDIVSQAVGGNFIFEASNDGTNWKGLYLTRVDNPIAQQSYVNTNISYAGTNSCYAGPTYGFVYFRVRVNNAFTSGNNNVLSVASNNPVPNAAVGIMSQSGSALSVYPNISAGSQGFYNFHTLLSAAGTNLTQVTSGQKNIGSIWLTNATASFRWFKVWNLASASVTLGTTSPAYNVGIPPNSTISLDMSFLSHRFGTNFTYAITAGAALLDNTSVGAGDVAVNLSWF